MKKTTSPKIADYDSVNYDYAHYWPGREYEDASDKMALEALLRKEKGTIGKREYFIDIGGSYGRELSIYKKYFKNVILFDYSLQTLIRAKKELDAKGVKGITYIAGNVYNLPFKDTSLDAGMMVRVMHHLKFVPKALFEIDRVIRKFFILEFANKVNAKATIRFLAKGKIKEVISKEPYQQEFRTTSQGSSGENQIFLNFHPAYIREVLKETRFKIRQSLSVSNFRSPALKKFFHTSPLARMEKKLQGPLAKIRFGPSIYYLIEKKDSTMRKKDTTIEELLACPICKKSVKIQHDHIECTTCATKFPITDGVLDLRYDEG